MRQSGCWFCLVGYYIVNPGRTFPQARPYYISVCTCARLNHSSEEDCADAEDNQTPPQRTTAHCTAQLRNVLRSAIESGVVVLKHTLCIMQLVSLFLLSFFFLHHSLLLCFIRIRSRRLHPVQAFWGGVLFISTPAQQHSRPLICPQTMRNSNGGSIAVCWCA